MKQSTTMLSPRCLNSGTGAGKHASPPRLAYRMPMLRARPCLGLPIKLLEFEAHDQIPYSQLQKQKGPLPLPEPPSEGTLIAVMPYIGKLALGEKSLHWRVACAVCLLITSKTAGMMCPIMLKRAVDAISECSGAAIAQSAIFAIIAYGVCDIVKHMAKELQAPIFTPVSQAAARRIAYHTFAHVLDLDIRFHLDKRTGRLSRILERGKRSIQYLYRAIFFTFIPTLVELIVVCTVLARTFSPWVAGAVAVAFAFYTAWTVSLTQLTAEARKNVIHLENQTSSKAVDALLNYETVTLFNNQRLELGQYDWYLKGFQGAAVHIERLSCLMNTGQSTILAMGLVGVMVTAVNTSTRVGGITPGDLIMIQGLLLQLWAPLQFLGWFYRELRTSLVDIADFFDILRTQSNIKDGKVSKIPDTEVERSAQQQWSDLDSSSGSSGRSSSSSSRSSSSSSSSDTVTTTSSSTDSTATSSSNGSASRAPKASSHHALSDDSPDSDSMDSDSMATDAMASAANYIVEAEESHAMAGELSSRHLAQDRLGSTGVGESTASTSSMDALGQKYGLHITLDNVKFGYLPERQILKGISLDVQPGSSIALVGSSGCGKSTILKLLTRLYDTSEGSVILNGVNVKDLSKEALRETVAVVPQDTVLFNDTILQNIRYGRPDATDDDVMAAATMARLHQTVLSMPEGYNTMVGERGLKLSGGEKQRVAIARAFLRSPRLLICDEATSALDSTTEVAIMSSLTELAQGRTSVFVAHRLSTIKSCDVIFVLREGTIVESGPHTTLMEKPNGLYRGMWEMQQAEEARGPHAEVGLNLMSVDDDAVVVAASQASTDN